LDSKLINLVNAMQGCKIMIIGDMVADVYLEGKISRISREAPVLILEHGGEIVVPGGAANTVHNAATLGGEVFAVGVIGEDSVGRELSQVLAGKGVNTAGLIVDQSRPTITKTRVMAGGQSTVRQQVVRIDQEKKEPLSGNVKNEILTYIKSHIRHMDVVVMSDYGSNTVSPEVISTVIEGCNEAGIPSIVDSRYNILAFTGITVVKQNESEAAAAVGRDFLDDASLVQTGQTILSKLNAQAVLITRGPDGMTLFEQTRKLTNIPVTNKSEVYDVTGAGDTVVAAMSLALAARASYHEAACLANYAAGVVVRKPGTATVSPGELKDAIGVHNEDS